MSERRTYGEELGSIVYYWLEPDEGDSCAAAMAVARKVMRDVIDVATTHDESAWSVIEALHQFAAENGIRVENRS